MAKRANPFGWPNWMWRLALGPIALLFTLGLINNLAGIALVSGFLPVGSVGVITEAAPGRPGWFDVVVVDPEGPAAAAGVERGDRLRYDGVRPARLLPLPGETLSVTIEHGDNRTDRLLVAKAADISSLPIPPPAMIAALCLSQLLSIAFGSLLLLRGGRSRPATVLGLLLLLVGVILFTTPWAPSLTAGYVLTSLYALADCAFTYLWPVFALEISGGAASRRQARVVHGVALAQTIAMAFHQLAWWAPGVLFEAPYEPWAGDIAHVVFNQFFGYGIIAWNYRRHDAPMRNRLQIVLLAFVFYMLWTLGGVLASVPQPQEQRMALATVSIVFSYIAPAVLAYAVLRRKLFDFGFALNRTLVYGAVSFVVLAGFGLAKWVIEHLIPESWHTGSEYYSVAIALGLFLVLHRVHDSVERNVEKVLFRPWHRNEEGLRRFVTAAEHFDQTAVLCRAFAEELRRFSGGAGVAVYFRDRTGAYSLQCGGLAEALPHYDADDLVLALMRAERRPVKTAEMRSALPGVLALPMLDQGRLAGFALLAGKPDGTDYRPDEVEVLGWAAHQIGLDLQAMRAGELEAEVARLNDAVAGLRDTNAQLSGERDRLAALLAERSRRTRVGNRTKPLTA